MTVPLVFRVLGESVRGWSRDNVPRLGASIAYYTLFSLAPILMIAIAIAGLLFGEEAVRGQIVHQADDLLGREGAVALQALLEGASRERDGGTVALIGTITFLVAATGAFMELQHALNTIFKVKQSPRSKLKEFIKDRVRSFGLVVSIGFLLLVSLLVSAALTGLSDWMQRTTGDGLSFIWQIVNIVISLAVITVLFALIFRYLPDASLNWSDVWMGAFITSLLFIGGKELIGLYLGRSSVASSYGAAGSVVVLLLWVYYAAQLVLLGAEITRVRAKHLGREPQPLGFARHNPEARPTTD